MNRLWYYRRDRELVGPVPLRALERYVLLGRVQLDDLVREEHSDWMKVEDCPALSEACRLIRKEDAEALSTARRHADERNQDRRARDAPGIEEQRHRDRRKSESPEIVEIRAHRAAAFEHRTQRNWMAYVYVAAIVILALLAIAFYRPVNPIHIGLLPR